jgi:peptide/nickel transport system permease protein
MSARSTAGSFQAEGRLAITLDASWRRFRNGWGIFSRNPLAVFGLVLLFLFFLMAVAHPILRETIWKDQMYDPQVGYDLDLFPHPTPPGPNHILGTDALGRDVASLMLASTTPTFIMAIIAALTTATIGTLIGAFSAYFRGPVDRVFTAIADAALLAPPPLVMIVLGILVDIGPVRFGLIYGLLSGFSGAAIVMRTFALTLITKPFIEASRIAGGGPFHIIFRHLVPHMLPLAAMYMMMSVVGAIFADGFTAFMGLSEIRLNWGSLIYSSFVGQSINSQITWNILVPSALAISLFAASFYFIARGLHQVAEPRLRER